jgi:photosystem II stability/assembly factor-like uncharacterized protein
MVSYGESLENISIIDQTYGWCASKKRLFRTIDGGISWQEMKLSIPQESFISQIHFNNRSLGWLVLQKYGETFEQYEDNYIWLLKTNDGGETWTLMYENKSIDATHLTFTNESDGWFVGIKYVGNNASSFILNTNDQGNSWNDVSAKFIISSTNNNKSHNNAEVALRVIQNGDETTVVTGTGAIIKTSDRGNSWNKIDAIEDIDDFFYTGIVDFGVTNDNRRWAIGAMNGEEGTWITVYMQTPDSKWEMHPLYGTSFRDSKYLFENTFLVSGSKTLVKDGVVTELGVIYYFSDAGITWTTIYQSNETESVNSIDVIGNEVWAVCKNGSVVKLNLPLPKLY